MSGPSSGGGGLGATPLSQALCSIKPQAAGLRVGGGGEIPVELWSGSLETGLTGRV